MELEELQASWEVLSKQVAKQEQLTTKMIITMTQQNFKSRLNKIGYPELAGTFVCYAGAAYLMANFHKINQVYLQVFALLCIAYLVIFPIISLTLLRRMSQINIAAASYTGAIENYVTRKISFQRLQKLNVLFTFILMLIAMPVLMAIAPPLLDYRFPPDGFIFPDPGLAGAPLLR